MRATIVNTDCVLSLGGTGVRMWEGVTEHGVQFVAYVALLQMREQEKFVQFQEEFLEQKAPEEWVWSAVDAMQILDCSL